MLAYPVTLARRLDAHHAVPLALLANELITNAWKYAWPGGVGDLQIAIQPTGPEQPRLTVSDNGRDLTPISMPGIQTALV